MAKYFNLIGASFLIKIKYPPNDPIAKQQARREAYTPIKRTLRDFAKVITFNKRLKLQTVRHQYIYLPSIDDWDSSFVSETIEIWTKYWVDADSFEELMEYSNLLEQVGVFAARQHGAHFQGVWADERFLDPFVCKPKLVVVKPGIFDIEPE